MRKKIIDNAIIVTAEKSFSGFIMFDPETGIIEMVEPGRSPAGLSAGCDVEDAGGAYLLPGVIDPHVHFRDGGDGSPKGDFESESRAAVAGGVTTVFDMPNTTPPTVTIEALEKKIDAARRKASCDVRFFFGVTNSNLPLLLDADSRYPIAGAKLFMGSSTGNMLVDSDDAISELFRTYHGVIAVQAEDQSIINANTAAFKERTGGKVSVEHHPDLRSEEACYRCAHRAVALARATGARLHVCHLSTARELELFTAGDVGDKRVPCETAPHYLLFSRRDYLTRGARVKCNPAIKEETDREALARAVVNGVIDVIATDHAPHLLSDKQGDALTAMSGMPGVQFSLPLMMDFAAERSMPLSRLVRLMCYNPAKIFSLADRGDLRRGLRADLVMVRRLPVPHVIDDSDVVSKCGWTPYSGLSTGHEVVATWVNGDERFRKS